MPEPASRTSSPGPIAAQTSPDTFVRQPLLCRYHHTHFLQKGWTCRINTDRLPEWIPPRWIDRDQRPQVNARIRRLHAQRQLEGHERRRRSSLAA
jgi:hypothetical protein